jgi:hypothetical protein
VTPIYIQDVKQWASLLRVKPLELQRFARSVNDSLWASMLTDMLERP